MHISSANDYGYWYFFFFYSFFVEALASRRVGGVPLMSFARLVPAPNHPGAPRMTRLIVMGGDPDLSFPLPVCPSRRESAFAPAVACFPLSCIHSGMP
jgi:hypothetical protein